MHWLIYTTTSDGRLTGLRIVESPTKPRAPTLNDGFHNPQEALALMSEWLAVDSNGFVKIDESRIEHHPTFAGRVRHVVTVLPAIVWLMGGAVVLSAIDLILIALHIAGG